MYEKAINYADKSNYRQVEAIALTGLGELERKHRNFTLALSHHEASIEILDYICAKCDLAEAYYQQGLTYQEMGETEKSEENFDKAIKRFEEIEAPKQVEKVRKAIEKVG